MPSYNVKGEPITNAYVIAKQPTSSTGGGGMGCGGSPNKDCNCCQTTFCLAISLTGLILIVKYTCWNILAEKIQLFTHWNRLKN